MIRSGSWKFAKPILTDSGILDPLLPATGGKVIRSLLVAAALMSMAGASLADDQTALDGCIASWGKQSPFKKGTPADSTIATGVKVFGIGASQSGSDAPTAKPSLVMVR